MEAIQPSDQSEIPAWVPEGVRRAALYYPGSRIAQRLLTDKRMEKVWNKALGRGSAKSTIIEAALNELPSVYRCAAEEDLTIQDRAAAALYLICIAEMCDTGFCSEKDVELALKEFKSVEMACQQARMFYYSKNKDDPIDNLHPRTNQELDDSLIEVAKYFEYLHDKLQVQKNARPFTGYKSGSAQKNKNYADWHITRSQIGRVLCLIDPIFVKPRLKLFLITLFDVGFRLKITRDDLVNSRK